MTDFLKSLKGLIGMNKTAKKKAVDAKPKKNAASSKVSATPSKKGANAAPTAKAVDAKQQKPAKAAKPAVEPKPAPIPVEASTKPVMPAVADDEDFETADAASDDEIVLTDAEGNRYCRVKDCDQTAVVDMYCRYHYLLLWKRIQIRKKILIDGKLERYVEELTSRYPDKFLEMIRRDLKTEKDFQGAIQELEIDESGLEAEFEDDQGYMDEVRGMGDSVGGTEEEF